MTSLCPVCGLDLVAERLGRVCPTHGLIYPKPIEAVEEKPGGSTPSQYAIPDDAVELQDLIEYRGMNFAVGNIFKAAYRMGVKHETDEYDLRKIIWFARRELKRQGFEE